MPTLRGLFLFVKNNWPVLTLITIAVFICAANYTPGTFLTGWDTLHPEFNFWLNLKRVVFGVWRQEQGLGAVAIHSHMVEIPRILFLWLASFVVPLSFLRYLYVFVCLILGPVGVYHFIRYALHDDDYNTHHVQKNLAAFLGGLFYLLNLATVQQFYVPFEMFMAQYASLGFLFLYATKLTRRYSRRDMLLFIVWLVIGSTMAYAATLFYAFFLTLLVYLAAYYFFTRHEGRALVKRIGVVITTAVLINSYWLLPNLYAVAFHSAEVENSKINSFFSPESFLYNQAFGNVQDVVILKGFLFNWAAYTGFGNFDYLLGDWRAYTAQPAVVVVEYALVGLMIAGAISMVRRKRPIALSVLALVIVCMLFLMNANPPFSWFTDFIRGYAPLVKEALRTPYTKFSILLAFGFAYLLAEGFLFLCRSLHFSTGRLLTTRILGTMIAVAILVSTLPVFTGHMISAYTRKPIPPEYFELYKWYNNQPPDGRIATLPMPSFWGWTYYDWGYQGAGFIWFGLNQPVLDRDFDRWSRVNEQYYKEMSYAIYSQDVHLFDSLLDKYQIKTVLFDDHVITPGKTTNDKQLYIAETKNLLAASKRVAKLQQFGDKITVYGVIPVLTQTKQVTPVWPQTIYNAVDTAYLQHGTYYTPKQPDDSGSIFYLFSKAIGEGDQLVNKALTISDNNYTVSLPTPSGEHTLQLPSYVANESSLPADFWATRTANGISFKVVYGVPWPANGPDRPATFFNLPTTAVGQNLWLTVNQSQPLVVPATLGTSYTRIGRLSLNTTRNNTISLFKQGGSTAALLDQAAFSVVPERCGRVSGPQLFGDNMLANGISLYSKNVITCVSIPLTSVLRNATVTGTTDTPILMQLDFDYIAKNKAIPYYCLFDTLSEQCIYTSYADLSSGLLTDNHFTDLVAVNQNLLPRFKLRLFLDSVNAPEVKRLDYANIVFHFSRPEAGTILTADAIAAKLAQSQFGVLQGKATSLTGFFPEPNRAVVTDITRIRRNPDTCSAIAPIEYNRNVVVNNGTRYVEYSSVNGTSCDYFDYQSLPHNQAYVVAITAKYVTGLPLRVCITNIFTRRCDIYTQLTDKKDFTTYYIYIPANTSPGFGYDVNFDNVSIGQQKTINQVKSVTVYPFPGNWFSRLAVAPILGQQPVGIKSFVVGNLPFWGNATLKPSTSRQILELNSAYEGGWQLFRLGGLILTPAGGQHVLVNSWANGWLIGPSDQEVVYIAIFMPQILEFAGFVLLVILVAWVVKRHYMRASSDY